MWADTYRAYWIRPSPATSECAPYPSPNTQTPTSPQQQCCWWFIVNPSTSREFIPFRTFPFSIYSISAVLVAWFSLFPTSPSWLVQSMPCLYTIDGISKYVVDLSLDEPELQAIVWFGWSVPWCCGWEWNKWGRRNLIQALMPSVNFLNLRLLYLKIWDLLCCNRT